MRNPFDRLAWLPLLPLLPMPPLLPLATRRAAA